MSGEDKNAGIFSSLEIDTIGEIMNISMGSAATAASTLLDHKVTITTPRVSVVALEEFDITLMEPATAVEIKYVEGISGSNILILRQQDVRLILGQMMQMEMSEDYTIDEIGESAMCELMNQMMGSSATVLSCFLGRPINISTPVLLSVGRFDEFKREHFPQKENILTIKFNLTITDMMESEFISVMDIDLAKEIIDVSLNFDSADSPSDESPLAPPKPAPAPAPAPPPPAVEPYMPPPDPAYIPPPAQPMPGAYAPPPPIAQPYPPMAGGYGYPGYPPPYPPQQPPPGYGYQAPPPQAAHQAAASPILVKDYEYSDFAGGSVQEMPANIDLVMDVPVVVTVELGRTKRKIKEILEFGQGSIVELDKQAGSQVDVIVNGQLIARGDVVVVDDNFSVRITEILKSRESLTAL